MIPFITDVIRSIVLGIGSLIDYFVGKTAEAGISPDPLICALLLIILTVWIGFGCWAGSIAGARKHSQMPHFILGMCIPVIYPLIIMFVLDVKGAKERQKKLQELRADEEKARAEKEAGGAEKAADAPEVMPGGVPEEEPVFDAQYFENIRLDDDGNPTGPWSIVCGESQFHVLGIVECLAEVLVVETEARDGQIQKMRLPYAKITQCVHA